MPSPLDDYVFARLFNDKSNKAILEGFLKAVLNLPAGEYQSITFEDRAIKRFRRNDKAGVVDVKVTTASGRIIHVELQREKKDDMENRILFYLFSLFLEQYHRGEKYGNIHQAVSIIICDHTLLNDERAYANSYQLRNDISGKQFTKMVKLVILELPKLPADDDGAAMWPWLKFLKSRPEEMAELAHKHPEVTMAVAQYRRMSLSERFRWWRFETLLRKMDRNAEIETRRMELEEKRAEGHAEGRAEANLEAAQKLKARGVPVETIAETLGLSIETVQKL